MTATTASKPPPELTQEIVNSVLERIAGTTEFFEQAWIEGLHTLSASDAGEARSLILAEAGGRLKMFDEIPDDLARRGWLRQVVEEVRLRGDGSLGELAAVATNELREAFARAGPAIADLRAAVNSGESLQEFAIRCPLAADQVRDLGRIAEGLRGSGLLGLCSTEDYELARDLARAMKPPHPSRAHGT